jgi:nucleotide-binding universal stress UspA family protein
MAKRYSAEIVAINVFGVPDRSFSRTVTDIRTGDKVDLNDDSVKEIKGKLKSLYAKQVKDYKDCAFEVLEGIPHTEILRMARKKGIDLIIMGARTDHDEAEASRHRQIAGRTLQGVARTARCPVLVIGRPAASFWGGISNIVFGTDFSKASNSAFQFSLKLAETFNCSLQIFHAIDISSDPFEITKSQEIIDDRIREVREKIRKKYVSKMKNFTNYEVDVWEGTPYVEIVKYSREKFADLIVLAHHTKKIGPESAVMGTTLEQVVLRSNCPVISVNHPDKI